MFKILALFSLFLFSSAHGAVQDFCVGDPTLPPSPAGYACKHLSKVTADDFVFAGLSPRANTSNINKATATLGTADVFPGINGLGLSMARLDLDVGGVIPLHAHPRASEMILVLEGTILTGFISGTNIPYLKTLNKYETMIFPQGLLHFQINVGDGPALAFVALNSEDPGFQATEFALFSNNFPTAYIEQTTLINAVELRRLKALFGGSG